MDDPGNLIYIAFLLISLVAGLIKNWRKNKEQTPLPQDKREVVEWDLDEINKAEEKRQRLEREAELKLQEMRAATQRVSEKKGKSVDRKGKKTALILEEESENNDTDLTQIDLRKAVIYSEILNPPYV